MKATLTQPMTSGVAVLSCPNSRRLRVMLVTIACTPNAIDQATLAMEVGGQTLAQLGSDVLSSNMTKFSFGIGLSNSQAPEDVVDPVTGAVGYSNVPDHGTASLPDVSWDRDVKVTAAIVAGGLSSGIVVYELTDQ
jgi:hypothetical protein